MAQNLKTNAGMWPHHQDKQGNWVPCLSNPCKLHSGKTDEYGFDVDIMAVSKEDADAIRYHQSKMRYGKGSIGLSKASIHKKNTNVKHINNKNNINNDYEPLKLESRVAREKREQRKLFQSKHVTITYYVHDMKHIDNVFNAVMHSMGTAEIADYTDFGNSIIADLDAQDMNDVQHALASARVIANDYGLHFEYAVSNIKSPASLLMVKVPDDELYTTADVIMQTTGANVSITDDGIIQLYDYDGSRYDDILSLHMITGIARMHAIVKDYNSRK